jgi:RHH-type rel operon transcriptional repressor/antitoxin RelB
MRTVRFEPELDRKVQSLARKTGRSKTHYARGAIRRFLEDREDYEKGVAALERREPAISLAELGRRLAGR